MLTFFLDLETCPGESPPGVVTEIAFRSRDERDRDPERFASLSPYLCRVACVGLIGRNGSGQKETAITLGELDESDVLIRTNEYLAKADRIVTYGGRFFDIPVLVSRMTRHGIGPCGRLLQAWREYRFRPEVHVDLTEILTQFGASKKPSLREVCIGWGIADPKAGCDGGDVALMVASGQLDKVAVYCLGDVRATAEVFDRLVSAGLIG